jgi:hypothetical protein
MALLGLGERRVSDDREAPTYMARIRTIKKPYGWSAEKQFNRHIYVENGCWRDA